MKNTLITIKSMKNLKDFMEIKTTQTNNSIIISSKVMQKFSKIETSIWEIINKLNLKFSNPEKRMLTNNLQISNE